jgi:hypothetical protein
MSIDNRNNWLDFVSRSSECGSNWIKAFRERVGDHKDLGFRAVARFQAHQYDKGLVLLSDYKKLIRDEPERGVMDHVLLRWYYAALAYYHYCTESWDETLTCLDLAQHSLELAIEELPFLVVLAASGEEFCLHKARVARNRRQWREMEKIIKVARDMVAGDGALCCLPSGREITFHDVDQFYFSIPNLSDEESQSLHSVFDITHRLSKFEEFVLNMYVIPGFVVVH